MPHFSAPLRALALASMLALAAPMGSAVGAQRTLAQAHHTHWGENEGLPYVAMDRIARSPDGYLWLGGDGPLVRFDGVRFTMFDGTNTPALSSPATGGIRPGPIDRDGTMWVTRPDGALVRYRDGHFSGAIPTGDLGSSVSLAVDRSGRLWVLVGRDRLHRLEGDSLHRVSFPAWLPADEVVSMVADTSDGVWLGTRTKGIVHMTLRGATALRPPGAEGPVQVLLQARDGTLWVWAGEGLRVLSAGRWREMAVPGAGERILMPRAAEAADGAVWIATRGRGVMRYNAERVEQFTERDGLSDVLATRVYIDAEGTAWIATGAGLDRLRPAPFAAVGLAEGLPYDLPVWIAPDASGAVWALSAPTRTLFRIDDGIVRGRPGAVTAKALASPPGTAYFPLAAARAGGLWVYDGIRGRIARATPERVVPSALALPDLDAQRVLEDRHGDLWAFTLSGRQLKRSAAGQWLPVRPATDSHLVDLDDLTQVDGGRLVVTRRGQPSLVMLEDGHPIHRLGPEQGLDRTLHGVAGDGLDTLWAYGRDSALYRIIGTRVSRLASPELAPLLRSSAALLPAGDRIFIATTEVITSAPRGALHAAADGRAPFPPLRRYSPLDGAHTKGLMTVVPSPAFRAADGRVWFSTPRGLLVFDERDDVPSRMAPHVHIEEVRAADSALALDSAMTIPAGIDRLDIRFTVTALRMPERARLEFRLDGVDADWRTADASRHVTYTQLRPRSYTFRVRGWNEEGVPAASEARLALRVLPLWHESLWFLLLATLAATGAVAGIVALAVRARAHRDAERVAAGFAATLAERTRLAGELHDTLLQSFTGITLHLQALRGRMLDAPGQVERDLGHVLAVADGALREARSAVWDMRAPDLQEGDVAAALETAAQESLASHLLAGGAPVEVAVTVSGSRRRVSPAAESAAQRIGREAVANALRHAKATRIGVSIAFEARSLCLEVCDDGVGFDVAHAHPRAGMGHWGLVGMRERAGHAGGTLEVSGVPGAGTTITLRLPIDS